MGQTIGTATTAAGRLEPVADGGGLSEAYLRLNGVQMETQASDACVAR